MGAEEGAGNARLSGAMAVREWRFGWPGHPGHAPEVEPTRQLSCIARGPDGVVCGRRVNWAPAPGTWSGRGVGPGHWRHTPRSYSR